MQNFGGFMLIDSYRDYDANYAANYKYVDGHTFIIEGLCWMNE